MLEFAMPAAGDVDVFARFPTERLVGLGCVDRRTEAIEGLGLVVERVEKALRYLHPDCGFAPSSILPIPLDEAYLKLRALGLAADRLRRTYG